MNREDRLREARTTEAMKNGYTGMEGKFALIAKRLGQPIMHQGSSCYEQTFLEDPFAIEDKEDTLPMLDEDDNSYEIGLHFDGLSRGANLSVFVHFYNNEIVVEYEGRKVYREIAGELERYAPAPEWESKIESFYNAAKMADRRQKPFERKKMLEEAKKKRQEIFDDFKSKWGLA